MSVYINGIEMPKGNDELRLIIHSTGQVIISHQTYYEEAEAVPVQPHGRLGDLDELYVSLKKWLMQNRHSMTEATRVWIRG
jgi:hypothetical protein